MSKASTVAKAATPTVSTSVTAVLNALGGSMSRIYDMNMAAFSTANAKNAPKCSDMRMALKPTTGMVAAASHSDRLCQTQAPSQVNVV